MIFLTAPNLIFIKTRKTAGTSIEIALSAHASEQDIVTPINIMDECIRLDMQGRLPVNWAVHPAIEALYRRRVHHCYPQYKAGTLSIRKYEYIKKLKLDYCKADWQKRFYNHITPQKIAARLGQERFLAAHKVTVVRHPYEQLVSHASIRTGKKLLPYDFWGMRRLCDTPFSHAVDLLLSAPAKNLQQYTYDDRYIIDTAIRFEHLREDLQALGQRFGLSLLEHLPVTKGGYRKDRRPAQEILTIEQMRRCYERNRMEFERFGYDSYL